MTLILNEKKYAENALKGIYNLKEIKRTLCIIAQYQYQYCGFRKKKITEILIDFLNKYYPGYEKSRDAWDATAEAIARKTGGNTLLEIDGIWLTQNEMKKIESLENKTLQRIVFVMLVVSKINDCRKEANNHWVNICDKDIFGFAAVYGSAASRDYRIHDLIDAGLVEKPKRIDKVNLRVTFTDDEPEAEKALYIDDVRSLGLLFKKEVLKDYRVKRCTQCGQYYTEDTGCRLCNECINIHSASNKPTITLQCIDCGTSFATDARSHRCRCTPCQLLHKKELKRIRNKVPANL